MPSPFEEYDSKRLLKLIEEFKSTDIAASVKFFSGDHWQDGAAWIGPPDLDIPDRGTILRTKVKPVFVSKNLIKSPVKRQRNGVLGREPNWTVTVKRELAEGEELKPDEALLAKEAEGLLRSLWDSRKRGRKTVLSVLQKATDMLGVTGKGLIRFLIPKAFIDENGNIKQASTPEDALKMLHLMCPDYDHAGMITDEDSQTEAAIFHSKKEDVTRIELSYLDDSGQTIIRVIETKANSDNDVISDSSPINLDGNLTIYEMTADPLVTAQVKQHNMLFNMSATMRTRCLGVSGFPETTFINAERPYHMEDDSENPGQQKKVYDNYKKGGGVVNFVRGIVDENNNLATPSLVYRDPTNPDTFDKTEAAATHNILEECDQLHVEISGDSTVSGESRIQARANYVLRLRDVKTQVDPAGSWTLETALGLIAHLSGRPGRYSPLRVEFSSRLDPGPMSSEERAAVLSEVAARIRSMEDAMTLLGIDDPAAMKTKILQEQEELNPLQVIQRQRAELGLENDRRNGDSGIPARIEEAAREPETVVN